MTFTGVYLCISLYSILYHVHNKVKDMCVILKASNFTVKIGAHFLGGQGCDPQDPLHRALSIVAHAPAQGVASTSATFLPEQLAHHSLVLKN